jgi:hypothetical protein
MKRTIGMAALVVAALAATIAAPVGATPAPGKKTTICHFTGKKYVAITVSTKKAMAQHVAHHSDITTGVPTGNKAARTFCASQTALTPTRGGKKLAPSLTTSTSGLSGTLNLRLRLGQGDVCLSGTITSNGGSVTVSSLTLTPTSGAPVNVNLAGLTLSGASPLTLSGCSTLSRTVVKSLLQSGGTATLTTSTPAGTLTGTFGS